MENASKKIDVSEKKQTVKTAEKFFRKGLYFDTLHVPIAINLSDLSIKKYQYFSENVQNEIEDYFNIMIKEKDQKELLRALSYYSTSIENDSITVSFGYPEKALSIGQKLLEMHPTDKNIRYRISFFCSNLSFKLFDFKKQHKNSLAAVKIAIEADSTNQFVYTNLPIAYLLNNEYAEAEKVYLAWKDKKWTVSIDFRTFNEAYLSDIADLERRGITHPDFEKVRELLKK